MRMEKKEQVKKPYGDIEGIVTLTNNPLVIHHTAGGVTKTKPVKTNKGKR